MNRRRRRIATCPRAALAALCAAVAACSAAAQANGQASTAQATEASARPSAAASPADVLPSGLRADVDRSVDRALAWLASQQAGDGSFTTITSGQPGVTSLVVLAFLGRGHLPGRGPYGEKIDRAIEYVLSCRKPGGLLCHDVPGPTQVVYEASHTAVYNHAISGVMLCQTYGLVPPAQAARMRPVIQDAVAETLRIRRDPPKKHARDRGGWRYYRPSPQAESDMSSTSWQLIFLRSAKNAGFEVPDSVVDEAVAYMERCYSKREKTFIYALTDEAPRQGVALAGIGVVTLGMAGRHDTQMARAAGDYILRKFPFGQYNSGVYRASQYDRYHYGLFYCTQATFLLGAHYWDAFFPRVVQTLLKHQGGDGAWQQENGGNRVFGNCYTTALVVLSLTTPNQLLPIFQR